MVGPLDSYPDGCQIGLTEDVVAIVAESSDRDFYTDFLPDIENLSWGIFETV